jgi:hypothetical protein
MDAFRSLIERKGQLPPGMLPAYEARSAAKWDNKKGRREAAGNRTVRSLDKLVQVHSSITLPPPGAAAGRMGGAGSGSKALRDVMEQQGLTKTQIWRMLDQLPHFHG